MCAGVYRAGREGKQFSCRARGFQIARNLECDLLHHSGQSRSCFMKPFFLPPLRVARAVRARCRRRTSAQAGRTTAALLTLRQRSPGAASRNRRQSDQDRREARRRRRGMRVARIFASRGGGGESMNHTLVLFLICPVSCAFAQVLADADRRQAATPAPRPVAAHRPSHATQADYVQRCRESKRDKKRC